MSFFKNLFGRKAKPQPTALDRPRGAEPVQSQQEQDDTRARMEAEMAEQREKRAADQGTKPENP